MKKTRDTKSILLRVLLYLFVILVVLVTLYPYFVMFTTAAKSRAEIYSTDGTLLPIHWLWQNFKDIWTLAPLSRYFINSLIVAGGSTLIAIVCGIPAAYALARMKFKGKKINRCRAKKYRNPFEDCGIYEIFFYNYRRELVPLYSFVFHIIPLWG